MKITAKIKKLNYTPTLCKELEEFNFEDLEKAMDSSTFILNLPNKRQLAISRWVSPKRTRSYPYARVYDTLAYFQRITIIPIFKDEGIDGERDYLQYDTDGDCRDPIWAISDLWRNCPSTGKTWCSSCSWQSLER